MKVRLLKKAAGQILIEACRAMPSLKPRLKALGLRTSKEWFGRRIVKAHLPDGRSIKLASASQNYLSFELFWKGTGYYEPITTLVLQQLVSPGTAFIDVGANIGFYSMILSVTQAPLDVVAFEPNPRLYDLLCRNASVNGLARVKCERMALSSREGRASLFLNRSDMSASLRSDFDSNVTDVIDVPTISLDRYLEEHCPRGRIVIKVDVEGHEEAFFEGARQTLAFRKPDIVAEVAAPYPASTVQLLRENGYQFYPITDEGVREVQELRPVVREPFVFLNYLLSARSGFKVAEVFSRIAGGIGKIDLHETSKRADFHAWQQMQTRAQGESADAGRRVAAMPAS